MRSIYRTTVGRASEGGGGTVRSMYEAAKREVEADPVAAVTKYQPTWLESLSPRHSRTTDRPGPARPPKR